MSDKIGVIVPVYKTEKYVAECIESILAQTFTNFRLILVDDGSPDGAGKICDEYAQKDNRITVIHQENAGVTRARAAGVEAADDCEWITFVDSDDTITAHALEHLYSRIEENIDIVINEPKIHKGTITTHEYIKKLIHADGEIKTAPWGKLFNKKLFNTKTFSIHREIIVGEDIIMNVRLALESAKRHICITNTHIYNYNTRLEGTNLSFNSSPLYEQTFHQELINSFSPKSLNVYHKETIVYRIMHWNNFWGYRTYVSNMKQDMFYKILHRDIKRFNYKLDFINKILFYQSNPVIRFIIINIKLVGNIVRRISQEKHT